MHRINYLKSYKYVLTLIRNNDILIAHKKLCYVEMHIKSGEPSQKSGTNKAVNPAIKLGMEKAVYPAIKLGVEKAD